MSGFEITICVLLAITVVLIGLFLLHKAMPTSGLSKFEDRIEDVATTGWATLRPEVQSTWHTFSDDAAALAAGFKRIEPALQTELQELLTAAEKRLTDTSSEDSDIAAANEKVKQANEAKQLKTMLIAGHIEKMTAHLATLRKE